VVVTAIGGRAGNDPIDDEDVGDIELPEAIPTEEEWKEREKRYRASRRADENDGAIAVEAFIGSLPGWKRKSAARFDEIIHREVPEARRTVKWHQPFYGVGDQSWFASFSAFSNHGKLAFACESSLEPRPPSGTGPVRRALDIEQTDTLDEEQVVSWVRQAADNPGMSW
jgi:hypothetical protein